jgi:hypothetical protein
MPWSVPSLANGIVLLLGFSTCALVQNDWPGADAQVSGKPDISAKEAHEIPPFPPHGVVVRKRGKQTVVSWDLSKLQTVSGYRVYRVDRGSRLVLIGETKKPPFTDNKSARGTVSYAVTALSTYGAESAPAFPASAPKRVRP